MSEQRMSDRTWGKKEATRIFHMSPSIRKTGAHMKTLGKHIYHFLFQLNYLMRILCTATINV
jgi:hypothetical protein